MPSSRFLAWDVRLLLLIYVPALIAGMILLPLWLPEILQLAGAVDPQIIKLDEIIRIPPHSSRFTQFLTWSAASPGEKLLGPLVQFPFVAILGFSAWAARLPSVLLAILNAFLFWRLVQRVNLRNQVLAVVLFAAVPIHYRFSVEARPFELGLTAVLISLLFFLRVLEEPNIRNAAYYAGALALCLYAAPFSVVAGLGVALFTLAFIQSREVRIALWHLLPAAIVPALLYLPYLFWAQRYHIPYRLVPPDTYWLNDTDWPMVFRDVTGGGNAGYALTSILILGIGVGVWRAYNYSAASQLKRQALFCLVGGAFLSLILNLIADVASNIAFHPSQLLWSLPGFMILFIAGLDWLESKSRFAAWPIAALFLIFCLVGNYTFLTSRSENMKALADAGLSEVNKNSCVVFVSERLSPYLFRTLQPKLSPIECLDFFHPRIIMLVHPYVEPNQQKDAEVYFRGLNFHEVKRARIGGGEIIVIEAPQH
jgi:Dolichyl-phosphate-mannose-protein mannosyltransferase